MKRVNDCIVFVVPMVTCEGCDIGFESEDVFDIDGRKLCRECKHSYHEKQEVSRVEDQIRQALKELPTDQLLTLELALAISHQSMADKSDVPDNVQLWMMRINEALHIKAPNVRQIGTSQVRVTKTIAV